MPSFVGGATKACLALSDDSSLVITSLGLAVQRSDGGLANILSVSGGIASDISAKRHSSQSQAPWKPLPCGRLPKHRESLFRLLARALPRMAAIDANHGPAIMPTWRLLNREVALKETMPLQTATLCA